MIYFGTRLSENLSRREPEGYLICLNVPVARTGTQDYLPSELGLSGMGGRMIPVIRPESEVFSPACIASFEGMPVTDDHPSAPEGVTAENIRRLQKGHAHNVRRGTGDESDLLLADLIVTDPALIEEILNGKREISCGYNYTLCEEDGRFIQREIRGNHVAVVDAGRAGPRVSIRDREPEHAHLKPVLHSVVDERSCSMKKESILCAKMMARMAKDEDVESLAEMITEIMAEPEAVTVPAVAAVVAAAAENAAEAEKGSAPVPADSCAVRPAVTDCGPEILSALQQIIALLSGFAESRDCASENCTEDETPPSGETAETAANAAETGVEAAAENIAEAVAETAESLAESVAQTAAAAAAGAAAETEGGNDPVEELIAEILESEASGTGESGEAGASPEEAVLSTILEAETSDEDPDPDERAADALRAALAAFRPQLLRMAPKDRQRFSADVAARMKRLSRGRSGNAYAALCGTAARDQNAGTLGRKIMENRNVNFRK